MIKLRIDKNDITPKRFETHIIGPDNEITRVLAGSEAHREYVPFKKIPKYLILAIITIEDQRFFRHHGVDTKGLIRSIVIDIVSFGKRVQGGSTITQQLIKNTCFPDWYSNRSLKNKLKRKVAEIFLAVQLEKKVSKKEIIENYLNVIYFGQGCYGVQTASKYYFNKNVWELNLKECAVLAGIPLSPADYNPISHRQKSLDRSNLILYEMFMQHRISKNQYKAAKLANISTEIHKQKKASLQEARTYSYFEDLLVSQIDNELMRLKDISLDKADEMLYTGGLRIHSTENQKIQQFCEAIYNDPKFIPDLNDPDGPQSAMILMDASTGHVLATVGGRGKKESSRIFNRAIEAKRNNNLDTFDDYFGRMEYKLEKKNGVSILDLVLAYADYENVNKKVSAVSYKVVYDYKGNVLLDDKKIEEAEIGTDSKKQSLSHSIHETLPSLIEMHFTKDVWDIGRVGNLVLGVWSGYDDNRPLPLKEEYYTFARRIWKEIATYIEKEYYYERN